MLHHTNMGEDKDTDIPSHIENFLFRGMIGKIVWLFLLPLF